MKCSRHGFTIGMERIDNQFFLSLKGFGKLTHEDYEKITPIIDNALEGVSDPHINAIIDGTELEGWELRAAWDDFKIGLKHGNQFTKIAILGNKKWQKYAAKIGNWFISGETQYFEDYEGAITWLQQ